MLTAWRAGRRGPGTAARVHDLREIVNAILYVCRTGIAWAYLPHDFPPYQTVYDYYAKWEVDGTTEALHDLLRQQVRIALGRTATLTAAIIDSQSVKPPATSANPAKVSMRARRSRAGTAHCHRCAGPAVDSDRDRGIGAGLDRAGQQILDRIAVEHPGVSVAWVDGGYNNGVVTHGARRGIQVEVVKRRDTKGFHVLPRRWVVERTLGWLMLHRRLVRDYEALPSDPARWSTGRWLT